MCSAHSGWGFYPPAVRRKSPAVTHLGGRKQGLSQTDPNSITFWKWVAGTTYDQLTMEHISSTIALMKLLWMDIREVKLPEVKKEQSISSPS